MEVMTQAFDPAYGEAWSRTQVENALLVGTCHYMLIAPDEAPDGIAGFALVRRVLDEAELLLIAVSPAWRRRGIGARLLRKLLAELKNSGVRTVMLEMRRDNPAEKLYRDHGFAPIGLRPKYYKSSKGERIDAITFQCLLQPADN